MDDASTFVFTPQWAHSTVWPVFRENLSSKRKENFFVEFDGFVSEQIRQVQVWVWVSVWVSVSVCICPRQQICTSNSFSSVTSWFNIQDDYQKSDQKEKRATAAEEKRKEMCVKEWGIRGIEWLEYSNPQRFVNLQREGKQWEKIAKKRAS